MELTDGSATVQVHQSQLETVIPQPGGAVLLLAGPHRGAAGTLVSIDEAAFCARVLVHADGKPEVSAEYEDVCKYRA